MLLFSTMLQIKKIMTKDVFVRLVIEWNQGSPYQSNIIPNIEWNGERNIRFGSEKLWLSIEEYRNEDIIAVRYEKVEEDGIVWDTDYVMNFQEMQMSIRLERSYLETALTVNAGFSTPHFITLLIEKGYIQDDGILPVLRTPVIVNNENLELIADIISGNVKYCIPVVYVSRTLYNEDPVSITWLASRLKGVAHVFAQKSRLTNARLRNLCDGQNEYNGAIGVYFPSKTVGHKRFLYREYEGADKALLEKVVRSVIQYCNSIMTDRLYTWQGVNNALLRDRLASQKEEREKAETAAKTAQYQAFVLKTDLENKREKEIEEAKSAAMEEANSLIAVFSDEMRDLQQKVEELSRANDALTYENQGLRAKLNGINEVPILYMGDEDELFQDEIKEMLLKAIDMLLKNTDEKTRQADVLQDILKSNGGYQGTAEIKAQTVKQLLKGYKKMSGTMRQTLVDLGFSVTEDGKHYKLTYHGDPRYRTILAKTASDGHAGMNAALAIIKNML